MYGGWFQPLTPLQNRQSDRTSQGRHSLGRARPGWTDSPPPQCAGPWSEQHGPRRATALCAFLSLSLTLACSSTSTSGKSEASSAPPSVVFTTVEPETVPIYGEYVGQTEAVDTVEIHSQVQGFLQKIVFKEGSVVDKGQLLFVIDPRSYDAVLHQAKASLAVSNATAKNSEQVVKRYDPLVKENAISKQQFDSAVATAEEDESNIQLAQAKVVAAQLNVDFTEIRAPMTGNIGAAEVRVGDLIQTGATLMATIYSISPVYVTFGVSEGDYLSYVKRRQTEPHHPPPIELIVGGAPYKYSGTVNMVSPTVSTTTGTLTVRASFPNPQNILKPGLFTRVRFVVRDAPNALLVPQSAIQQLQGTESLLLVGADNKVQQITVSTGATVGAYQIVTAGLNAGDRVIVEGTQKAQPGMPVKAEEEPQPPVASIIAAEENVQEGSAQNPRMSSSPAAAAAPSEPGRR
ncbi:MAG TPA: efflux RND transporter periplasmic adaptor subunit [Bryobacteraceae bacterium]|nr:efflux RND transporter periplasmic adaptor subunit [Bryobacteraceae bacterium]